MTSAINSRSATLVAVLTASLCLAACRSEPSAEIASSALGTTTSVPPPTTAPIETATTARVTTTTTGDPATTGASADAATTAIQEITDRFLHDDSIEWAFTGIDAPPTLVRVGVRIPGHEDILVKAGTRLDGSEPAFEDPFPAGSLAESLVETVAWQLIDEGALDPQATVDQWRADLPNAASVTVGDLLGHTTGWPKYDDDGRIADDFQHSFQWDELLDVLSGLQPMADPGTFYQAGWESNILALAYIVEQVTGESITDLVTERISTPLGLEQLSISDGTPEPEGTEEGVFAEPSLAPTALDTTMFPHTAFRTFWIADESAVTTVTSLLDLIDAWIDGSLFTTDRSAQPERFRVDHPIADTESQSGVIGDGTPLWGYCPCQPNGDLMGVTAIGRRPSGLATGTWVYHYIETGITVVLHYNSFEVTDASLIRPIVDAIHAVAEAEI